MEENREISPIIHRAIDVMKKCFGGTDVKLLSTEMYRLEPTEGAKAGKIGVDIEIMGVKTFLSYNDVATDIALTPYGEMIANEFVYTVIKNAFPDKLENVSPTFGNTVLPAVVGSQTKYQIVYADPAWTFKTYSEKGKEKKSAENHYKCMTIEDIYNLPINKITDDNCVLFLWVTMPLLQEGLETIKRWGFTYKTCAFNWVKKNKKADSYFWGLGYWTRANSELCLLATKGKPKRISKSVHQICDAKIQEHSKKPDEIRNRIVELCGDLPRIELFARQNVNGWDAWGNEVAESVNLETSANNGR